MKRIVINGPNGYVASHFILELLERNYEVIALIRRNGECTPEERMNTVLTEISGGRYRPSEKLRIYAYSLVEENFSIPPKQLKEIFSVETDYFHFAASLKYDAKSKEEIFVTNISGVENSIRVFSRHAVPGSRFFMVSTAYSCGRSNELFKEVFYENNEDIAAFRNYYEQSKRFAENIIAKHISKDHLPGHVIRLSQVVGDSRTGVTKTCYGIFDFARRVYNLSHRYPDRTIRVRIDPDATQNLIAINTVVDYLMCMTETAGLPTIVNMVSKKTVQNGHIIESLNRLLPIRLVPDNTLEPAAMNVYERIMSIGMSFTGAYSQTNILFDTTNLDALFTVSLPDNGPDETAVFRMLQYFIESLSKNYTPVR
ncbi:Pseudomonas fluorescens MupV-like, extended (e) SDRs [Proteiniphilum saccharofermentans]|uniref:Pseudomonas fluorescens MupV-like, extended (E) SDRs n=1 Tax=Proteiniphilum saccharofermentans TaxID=1642647 RepID=A0A1R3TAC5_9BACT|nr:SDR family oxidoreductase [Proteiniphilum saccharofermentans]SCD20925.1 Pseudomonas fluorescens MupV-like, extended (e) SDRs [Proteiniphilum saccharofermentans]